MGCLGAGATACRALLTRSTLSPAPVTVVVRVQALAGRMDICCSVMPVPMQGSIQLLLLSFH